MSDRFKDTSRKNVYEAKQFARDKAKEPQKKVEAAEPKKTSKTKSKK